MDNTLDKGVAPEAGIISGKVVDNSGGSWFSDVLDGIYWAVDNYVPDVINISIGTGEPNVYTEGCDGLYPAFTDAVKYALDHNVIVVVSAGNMGNAGVTFPGCVDYSFTVGAVNANDEFVSFSGQGKGVDVYAPGVDLFSTSLNNGYRGFSGTSASTPLVAGVIALMKQKNPNATALDIQTAILESCDTFVSLGETVNRINVARALSLISPAE